MRENNNQGSRKKEKILMLVSIFFFMLLCAAIGTGATFYNFLSSLSKNVSKDPNAVRPITVKDKNDPVNILVMGVDIGAVGLQSEYEHKRTDTIILMNYNPRKEEVNMISIPRDTLVRINGKNQKINAAHAIGGVQYLISCVEELLDIKVNYYGKVNYDGFRQIVDIIGGVDMKINQRMDYDDPSQNLHIHFTKGEQVHLNGQKSEEFFRWRKNNDGTGLADGDLGRIENQHLFIGKVLDKFKNVAIIPKLPEILKTVPQYSETNMGSEDILRYGIAVAKVPKEQIKMYTLQGDPVYVEGVSYVAYDEKKNSDALSAIHQIEKSPALDKGKLKIQVLNGTRVNGIAGEYSKKLQGMGYSKVVPGNGQKTASTAVTVYGIDKSLEDSIKRDFGTENVTFKSQKDTDYDIVVLLGDDYKR